MRIKITHVFRIRRMAGYTRKWIPNISEAGRQRLLGKWRKLNSDRLEKEIFNSCIVLKNLAIVHQDLPMSADFILEQLMQSSKSLRNVFADMLSAYRNGREDEAFSIMYLRVPIKPAKNFAAILSKLDQINPAELIVHMAAFEETFASERMTKGIKRAERKSLITTMMASASIFAILLNFTIVVVFMDTLNLLGQVF